MFGRLLLVSFLICGTGINPSYSYTGQLPIVFEKTVSKTTIPKDAISISISQIDFDVPTSRFKSQAVVQWQEHLGMNPASTMKLLTTLSAMDILGPDFRWKTDLYTNGRIDRDTLVGDLLIRGSGDPKLIPEEITKVFSQLRTMGIQKIKGDLIFDRSFYDASVKETSFSDGEPTRAYNAKPDALLFSFNSLSFQFFASPDSQVVLIKNTPRMANLAIDNNLVLVDRPCEDWRKNVSFSLSVQANQTWLATFSGEYPSSCKTASFNFIAPDSDSFLANSLIASWEDVGGTWLKQPQIKKGSLNNSFNPILSHQGIPLFESIKDINKLSNNVMARQVLLTLGSDRSGKPSNTTLAEKTVRDWLKKNQLEMNELVIENGSGLSRIERISAQHLNDVLLLGLNSKYNNYFIDSLPIAATDGTMKHRLIDAIKKYIPHKREKEVFLKNTAPFPESLKKYGAYIKTGSLVDVRSISGYVVSKQGRLYTITSFINHPQAGSGRAVHDALLQWLLDDGPNL